MNVCITCKLANVCYIPTYNTYTYMCTGKPQLISYTLHSTTWSFTTLIIGEKFPELPSIAAASVTVAPEISCYEGFYLVMRVHL